MTWTSTSLQMEESHSLWHLLDYLFLIVSFFAIYKTATRTRKNWLKIGFWSSWFFLLTLLINEKLTVLELSESLIYLPTISIIILHSYNLLQPLQVKPSQSSIKHSIQ